MSLNDQYFQDPSVLRLKRGALKRPVQASSALCGVEESFSTPHKRRRQTNQALEVLGQLIRDADDQQQESPSTMVIGEECKFNKNDILSLTLARLMRQKHLPLDSNYEQNAQLTTGINMAHRQAGHDINAFVVALNTEGRIVVLADSVDIYLRKNVRSLYPQLTSIFDCVLGDKDRLCIQQVLNNPDDVEHHLITTWHLPRGKRPSRTQTETKAILITGHFIYVSTNADSEIVDRKKKERSVQPLFVARCEQLLSSTPNVPPGSASTVLKFVLTDQTCISETSSNTQAILGYKADELKDKTLNRLVASDDLSTLEQARTLCIQGQQCSVMCLLDIFTREGERLSFLCNLHMQLEGRRKTTKLGFLAQTINPSLRNEYIGYVAQQNADRRAPFHVLACPLIVREEAINNTKSKTPSPPPSKTTNILSSANSQSEVSPPTLLLPQRRKRRKMQYVTPKCETIDLSDSQISSSTSLSDYSTASPQLEQENRIMCCTLPVPSKIDEDLSAFDDIFRHYQQEDDMKPIRDFPTLDDCIDTFGFQHPYNAFCSPYGGPPLLLPSPLSLTPTVFGHVFAF